MTILILALLGICEGCRIVHECHEGIIEYDCLIGNATADFMLNGFVNASCHSFKISCDHKRGLPCSLESRFTLTFFLLCNDFGFAFGASQGHGLCPEKAELLEDNSLNMLGCRLF